MATNSTESGSQDQGGLADLMQQAQVFTDVAAAPLAENVGMSIDMARVAVWILFFLILGNVANVLSSIGKAVASVGGGKRDLVLLFGPSNSGKTSLFHMLRNCPCDTVSSLRENRETLDVEGCQREIVDCPGHMRLRLVNLDHLKQARCVVYMVDGTDKISFKEVAEHLYEIFTHPEVNSHNTPILLACNKSDAPKFRSPEIVQADLEREIERLRRSRGATLEGQDEVDSFLGIDGEAFQMAHAPCQVDFVPVSVKSGEIGEVTGWIHSTFN